MNRFLRLTSLLAFFAVILLLTGTTPTQGNSYTVYFESDRSGESEIYRIDGDNATVITTGECSHPSVTADGSILLYSKITVTSEWGTFWNVYILKDGEESRLSFNEIYDEFEPAINRDGTFAAYTSLRAGSLEIITVPMDQSDLQYNVSNSPKPDESPALANGDDWVYWTGRTGNYSYIFRAPGRGGAAERVTNVPMIWEEHPSVSADQRWLVYTFIAEEEEPEDEGEEESGDEDEEEFEDEDEGESGDEEDKVIDSHKYPGMVPDEPEPDPFDRPESEDEDGEDDGDEDGEDDDGRPEGNSDIWLLDLESGDRWPLTTSTAWDGNPTISADGEKIVFTSDRDGNYEIYMINRDGTGLTRLTFDDAVDDFATIT